MNNEFLHSLTKEQRKIYRDCKKEADEFFCRPKGYVLHHVDPTLKYEDIGRYIQWRPEDLVMMSISDHANWHAKHDENWKKKLSEAHKGKQLSEETKQKMSLAKQNMSEETKQKMSENNGKYWKGKHRSEETRKKISDSEKGKHVSKETRKKISESKKGVNTWTKGKHWHLENGKRVYTD